MRLPQTLLSLLLFFTTIHALALPAYLDTALEPGKELFKRKGGGGGGGRGGGVSSSSGSSSSGSRGGSGSSSSSSGSSSGSSRGGSGSTSSSSGTGAPLSYGGGSYYGGGATSPYRAGTSRGGIAPYVIGGAALGIFPGLWLASAYAYDYPGRYNYRNESENRNESLPTQCWCEQYNPCGCDSSNYNDTSYLTEVANSNLSTVAEVNGTRTLLINGTLENGTTAPGDSSTSAASGLKQSMLEMSGFWVVIAGVIYTVLSM